jgi:predicted permease
VRILSRFSAAIRNIFRTQRVDEELDAELREYVNLVAAEHASGQTSADDARRMALLEVGGFEQIKEEVRDVRAGSTIDVFMRDIRYGTRSLLRTPAFTIAATLALALGVGATTAILSVVNGVLLRPLPYADSDRLVVVLHQDRNPVAPANMLDWRAQTRSFTDLAAAEYWTPNLTGADNPEQINGLHVSAGMLPMLGVAPLLGRIFTADEDVSGREHVAVISFGLWQRRFGGDRNIVGRQISLDGNVFTIVGVMPPSFQFAPFWATHSEIWAPLALGERSTSRQANSLRVFGRLRPGVSIEKARLDLAAVTARLEREYPGTNRDVTIQTLKHKVVGDIETPLLVLLCAVAFVLLIACANVAHMLLARAAFRQKELAIRTALGATQRRLVAQLLVESALLAVAGGAAGLLLALWGVRALITASPAIIPRVATVTIDGRVLIMTTLITATTAIVFGLVPALRASRVDLAGTFKDGDRGSTEGHGKHRLRSALVMSEFALALVLLVGAGLMIRSFNALRAFDPGFDPRNVITMTISTKGTKEADPAVRPAFFSEVLTRVRSIPGIESAAFINHLPITGDQWGFAFAVEGQPTPKPGESPTATYRVVYPGYSHTMRIPILRGRDIGPGDRADAPNVVVINEYMAKTYWPGQDAIGKRISLYGLPWVTVVGITKNAVISQWGAKPAEEFYFPFYQSSYATNDASHFSSLTLVARVSCANGRECDPSAQAASIVGAVRAINRNVPISAVASMNAAVDGVTAESRFYLMLLSAFAAIALALAAVGIYGVMSYSVSRRTHEIGIRIALGAEPSSVQWFIVRQGMTLAAIGGGVGVVAAFALTRLMTNLLYGVGASDPLTFAGVTTVLCSVAALASYLPALRATRIDPLQALRSE